MANSPLAYGTEWDTSIGERAISYLLYKNAGAPSNGVTLANVAPVGCLLVDTTVTGSTTGFYQNTGTTASPTWTALTTATGAGTYTGTFSGSVAAPVSAAATAIGSTAVNSFAIINPWTQVTTAASTAVGVTLPASTAGASFRVSYSAGTAASIKVWPTSTEQIDAGGAGTNQVITKGKTIDFICFVAGLWESHAMGAATS